MGLNRLRLQAILSSQARKKNLPYLCELEYLESTGEQYINIGKMLPKEAKSRHETSIMVTQIGTVQREGFGIATRWYGISEDGYYTLGGSNSKILASTTDYDNVILDSTGGESSGKATLIVNEVQILTRSASMNNTSNTTLFAGGNTGGYACYFRKKYHKFYVNDVLYFDGIPVLDYNMKPAMYDRVTKKLFYNEGTGADFKYGLKDNDGNLYTSVPYIESTGKEIIRVNLPITGTQKVKHVCCQQYVTQEGLQLEGFVETGRAFGTNKGYYYIASYTPADVMSSTTDFDKIVFESEVGRQSLTVNGTEISTKRFADMKDTSGIRLFAAGGNSYVCYLKKKYHLFYLDNKLVFAGVAVIDTKGVAGLFDIVTKTMFRTNSGQFIVGE